MLNNEWVKLVNYNMVQDPVKCFRAIKEDKISERERGRGEKEIRNNIRISSL